MSDRLAEIALKQAQEYLANYDFINIAEQQAELDLTDDEVEEIWNLVVEAKVTLDVL